MQTIIGLGAGIVIGIGIVGLLFPKIKAVFFRERKGLYSSKRYTGGDAQLDIEEKLWHEQETDFVFKLHEELSFDIDAVMIAKHVVEGIHTVLFVQRTVLLLTDKDTETLRIGYSAGVEEEMLESFVLKKRESIAGFVIEGKRPFVVNDLQKEYFLQRLNKELYLQKSFISIPLIFQNETLGLLYVCDKKTGKPFTKRDTSFLMHVGKIAAIALENARLQEQIQNGYLTMITTLAAAIDARDHYTESHSENVTKYAMAIAEEMKYPLTQRETLRRAALLHDIGKIGIKDELLLKSEALSDDEREQFKRHPEIGERIVRSLAFLKEAAVLTRHHHEHYNGKGYPDGLRYDEIEWGARILSVADSFDAMTSDRTYRKALSFEQAIQQLQQGKGSQFDPLVVDCFIKVLEKNPNIISQEKSPKDMWDEYEKKAQ